MDYYFSYLLSFLTPLNVTLYVLIHALTYQYAISQSEYAIKKVPELDQKYKPFARTDRDTAFTWSSFPCNFKVLLII